MFKAYLLLILINVCHTALEQAYSLVIKGGHVIDARNNINEVMDIAVSDGKIARVAKSIDESKATQVVNAKGCT